jgi:hypothetical protein
MNVMSQAPVADAAPNRFFDQRELLRAVLRRWILVVLGAAIGILYAINYLHSAPFLYQAQMQVTPVQPASASGAQMSASGGLASLASIALPTMQGGSDFRLYLDSLTSREIADKLAEDPELMHTLYAGAWDPARQRWVEPPRIGSDAWIRWFKDLVGIPSEPWHEPNGESLLQFMGWNMQIIQDARKPYLAKIVFLYYDRPFAVDFLNKVHRVADDTLRQRALRRTTDYIAYLSNALNQVTIAEHRAAITAALSEQEKSAMVARSGSAYAADLFEQPWAISLPVYPNATRVLLTDALVGSVCGAFLAALLWFAGGYFGPRWTKLRTRYRLARGE